MEVDDSLAEWYDNIRVELGIIDPGFSWQWHLLNVHHPGHDINVTDVWREGEGVVIAIIDDGLDMDSRDLEDAFYPNGSYDFNDQDSLPRPQLWDDTHGTRCAGEIAARRNHVCGIGVAFQAKIAGIRILSGPILESDEAAALNYAYQENQIYSCSWGPPDDGKSCEAPSPLVQAAFKNGVDKGRDGKGSIFVYASGNGGASDDDCNFDGWTNSIYSVTMGAIDEYDRHPIYSEKCSALLAVTYSSGPGHAIFTTDVGKEVCCNSHGGTSAAAPIAAGIFALALQIRPDLTWRDIQYLCVQTAIPVSLEDPDWETLPSGRAFNHKFGFGKLDAFAFVNGAKTFRSVSPQVSLELPIIRVARRIPQSIGDVHNALWLESTVSVTQEMTAKANLRTVEHVTVTINIDHQRRGDLEISLISPAKLRSKLASHRRYDASNEGLHNWTLMSVKHWQENPVGIWTLSVCDRHHPESTGMLLDWKLTIWGASHSYATQEPTLSEAPLSETLSSQQSMSTNDMHEDVISKSMEGNLVIFCFFVTVLALLAAALCTALKLWRRLPLSGPQEEIEIRLLGDNELEESAARH